MDYNKVAKEILPLVGGEKNIESAGQLQVIIGQGAVNKVYDALISSTNISKVSMGEAKKAAMKNMNPLQRFARVLSNIFVPIIPAIVASGLLMGVLGMCSTFWMDKFKRWNVCTFRYVF